MAFFPVISFVLLLLFGSVDSWAGCSSHSNVLNYSETDVIECRIVDNALCAYSKSTGNRLTCNGRITCPNSYIFGPSLVSSSPCTASYSCCDNQCSADSLACLQDPNAVWDSDNCKCGAPTPPPPSDYYSCQNAGGPEPGGFGAPRTAQLYHCNSELCLNTAQLSGTCQDWGFCSDGEDQCFMNPDSTGAPPCGRSGSGQTSSTACYYACADGSMLRCKPVSTQYVAGAIYVGECPSNPPADCYPRSSSSGGNSSSSGGGNSSSSGGGGNSSSSGGGGNSDTDYMPILIAIHDTLHTANNWR